MIILLVIGGIRNYGYGDFFAPDNPLYEPMKGMELIPQYLQEECNFGCAFFYFA
ncbi:YutD-like domain-containing protein [Limosilactobacillus equigenerosi]|uniref:YutD-like domain-containing protein n=1 Tax=Limosilactobacillus equigenerosi TaxID=417373 RepID=UPI0034E29371